MSHHLPPWLKTVGSTPAKSGTSTATFDHRRGNSLGSEERDLVRVGRLGDAEELVGVFEKQGVGHVHVERQDTFVPE